MKYLYGILLFTLIITILLYAAGSFAHASFDIRMWSKDSREIIAGTWFMIILMGSVGSAICYNDNKL